MEVAMGIMVSILLIGVLALIGFLAHTMTVMKKEMNDRPMPEEYFEKFQEAQKKAEDEKAKASEKRIKEFEEELKKEDEEFEEQPFSKRQYDDMNALIQDYVTGVLDGEEGFKK